ncbi:MAG: 2Fe-2S iron-sulfur cluster binding domain-containing protein [Burkholderiaceae bacterium]|nr:2Fe-2S iron-sulfur cluster binding domain-containing protein [Sulfuritalea sp.]MCF8174736.1 2Fe-2S iron-sulfur cluster binding domain-containing protein [Burkholderiaceae bacterium]
MSQWLTLSRAAHLLGISRVAMQKRIREGELPSFDGMVAVDDLQRSWPELDLDESGSFEKTRAIREDAFARRLRERVLPTQETLAQRLFEQGQELAEAQRTLTRYHALFDSLQARLAVPPPPTAAELGQLLDDGLAQALSVPAPADDIAALDAMLRVMSAHVTVKPSGREFFVEGSETLLKAALRAGLSPNYGCGNGVCGLCKARVVAGETRTVSPSDYRFTEAEKSQNHVLMCSCTALSSDLQLEVLEAAAPEDIPEQRIVAKVRSLDVLSADVMRLHLQTPRSNRLRFLAGQRVTLGVSAGQAEGSDLHGEFPVASCPCDDRNLLFHVSRADRRAASADFSRYLFAGGIKAGDDVSVWGPWGRFVLEEDSARPLVFIAIDEGFAPINSLIEHAIAVDAAESIVLYWASTQPGGQYLPNQCRAWSEALDEFSYQALALDDLSATLAAHSALPQSNVYLAGAAERVPPLAAALLAAGVPPQQLHVEAL